MNVEELERLQFAEMDQSIQLLCKEIEENTIGFLTHVSDRAAYAAAMQQWMTTLKNGMQTANSREALEKYGNGLRDAILTIRSSYVEPPVAITPKATSLNTIERLVYRLKAADSETVKNKLKEKLASLQDPAVNEYKQAVLQLINMPHNDEFKSARTELLEWIKRDEAYVPIEIYGLHHLTTNLENQIAAVQATRSPLLEKITSGKELLKDFLPNSFGVAVAVVALVVVVLAVAPPVGLAIAIGAFMPPVVDIAVSQYERLMHHSREDLKKMPVNDVKVAPAEKPVEKSGFSWSKAKPWMMTGLAVAGIALAALSLPGVLAVAGLPLAITGLSIAVGVGIGLAAKHIYNRYRLSRIDKEVAAQQAAFAETKADLIARTEKISSTAKIEDLMGDDMKELKKIILEDREQDQLEQEQAREPVEIQNPHVVHQHAPSPKPSVAKSDEEEEEEGDGERPEPPH